MLAAKLDNLKISLAILCIFAVSVIFISINKDRYYVLPAIRSLSVVNSKVIYGAPSAETVSRSFAKLFAYYILTEKCIPPYYLESIALGNSSRCDVYVNSFKEKCDDKNIPKHITHIFEKTTWSAGRNLLYYHVKGSGKRYSYHIFLDDDAIPIYTDHVIEFRKANPNANFLPIYLKSEKGLKEGLYLQKEGKSAWRQFEDDLLIGSPSFAITNYIHQTRETKARVEAHWKEVCAKGKEMPSIVPTFYLDELFIAFHEEALPIMLPYTTMFESISWWASGILHIFRGRAILYRSGVANYKVTVINRMHRPYPRGTIPSDFLAKYLAGDGKDLKGLIDEREIDWKNYDSWWKFETAFMHTKAICTVPLKFPANKNYALKRL